MFNIIKEFKGIVLAPAFDPDVILDAFMPTFKSLYVLCLGILGPVLVIVIMLQGFKYLDATDKDDRSLLDFVKKIGLPLGIGVFLASLTIVLQAFGFRLW